MALTGNEIFNMLPQTNCKECGFPACLAFAVALAGGKAKPVSCPYLSDEIREKLEAIGLHFRGNFSIYPEERLEQATSNNYVGVRQQQGVPLLDCDWNELDDIRKYEHESFLELFVGSGVPKGFDKYPNDGFRIYSCFTGEDLIKIEDLINQMKNTNRDREIQAIWRQCIARNPVCREWENNFTINSGCCLVKGLLVKNSEDSFYTAQPNINPITTPSYDNQIYLVYLDVWEEEVNDDNHPIYQRIGISPCMRLKRKWAVRVDENVSDPDNWTAPNPLETHAYYPLAEIRRPAHWPIILRNHIIDRRLTGISLTEITSATGLVLFQHDGREGTFESTPINPGLGPGKMLVDLGIEEDQIIIGNASVFGKNLPFLGAKVNQKVGMFTIGLKIDPTTDRSDKTLVRWWASKPKQEMKELMLPKEVYIEIISPSPPFYLNQEYTFHAKVYNSTNQDVTWTGTDSHDTGKFTAKNIGDFTITATSLQHPNKSATISVKVGSKEEIYVTIKSPSSYFYFGQTYEFVAEVFNSAEGVTWTGTDSPDNGKFTPKNVGQPFTITATSKEDLSKFAKFEGDYVNHCLGPGPDCTAEGLPGRPCTGKGPDCTSEALPDRPCTASNADCTAAGLPGIPKCTTSNIYVPQ